jgi:hypothetical protein
MKPVFLCLLLIGSLRLASSVPYVERERTYLQTDKQLYLSGELLWMKLYTTDAQGRLRAVSKIGYVELLSDSVAEARVMLDLRAGVGAGWMELPERLPTGYYRLVAYTRWMRNEGSGVFFEKIIGVINPLQAQPPTPLAPTAPLDSGGCETSEGAGSLRVHPLVGTTGERFTITLSDLPEERLSLAVSVAGVEAPALATVSPVAWKLGLKDLAETPMSDRYLPEYEGHLVHGAVVTLGGEAAPLDEPVSALLSFPGRSVGVYGGQSNDRGLIRFHTAAPTGVKELATVVLSTGGAEARRIELQTPWASHAPRLLPPLRLDSCLRTQIEMRSLGLRVMQAYLADSLCRTAPVEPLSYYLPYRSFVLNDYTRFEQMDEIFTEYITLVRLRRTPAGRQFYAMNEERTHFSESPALVLLDNVPVADHEQMAACNPLWVERVDVFLGPYFFGGQRFDGMVSFRSYRGDYPGVTFGASTQIFDYEGTQPFRYFYSPEADSDRVSLRLPDFRHTLYWEPLIETHGADCLRFSFRASHLAGTYLIRVEGFGSKGATVNASCLITVKAQP